MIRMMRADAYRVLRDKFLYIALAVLVAVVILMTFVFQSVPGFLQMFTFALGDETRAAGFADGAAAAQMALFLIPALSFIFLPLFRAVTIGFQDGVMKNEISAGMNRTRIYLSKWALSSALSMVYVLIFFATIVLFTSIISGFGKWGDGVFMSVLQSLGVLMLFVMAFNSVGVFFSFLFKKAFVVVEVYWFFLLAPVLLVSLFGFVESPLGNTILLFCLTSNATRFAQMSAMAQADMITGLVACLAFIVIPIVLGIFRFKKAEIK